MIRARFFARTALGLVVALGVAAGTAAPALAKDKDKDKQAAGKQAAANSKEFATASAPLQKTLADAQPLIGKFNAAPAGAAKDAALAELRTSIAAAPGQLTVAEASIKTPGDRLLAGRWGAMVGSILGDSKINQRAYQNILESGVAPAEELNSIRHKLGVAAYLNDDYAGAIAALTPLVTSTYQDPSAIDLLADSHSRSGHPAEGLKALKAAIDARKAAGAAAPIQWYKRGNAIAFNSKSAADSMDWSYLLVEADPSYLNWLSAVQIVRDYTDVSPSETVDLGRLIFRNGAINFDKKYSERQYVDYIDAADYRRFPGEVAKVAEAGIKAGILPANDKFVAEALSQAKARMGPDKASLPALEKDARAPNASLATILAAADVFLSYDEPAKAVEFYNLALTKPGVDVGKTLTRIGIAQYDLGQYAQAQETLAKVEGSRKPIARLWSLQARNKAAGK